MDTGSIILIAILAGGAGIILSFFVGKAVGKNEQMEAVNDLQYQLGESQSVENIYQDGRQVPATLESFTGMLETLQYKIDAYWFSETGVRYSFTAIFNAYNNFNEIPQTLSQLTYITVYLIYTGVPENDPYRMIRPWY